MVVEAAAVTVAAATVTTTTTTTTITTTTTTTTTTITNTATTTTLLLLLLLPQLLLLPPLLILPLLLLLLLMDHDQNHHFIFVIIISCPSYCFYLFQGVASCWIPTDSCWKIGFKSKPLRLLCRSGADCLQSSPHDTRHWTQPRQNATGIWLCASSFTVMCHTEVVCLILSATMNILPLFNMLPIFLLHSDWMHVSPYKICNIIFSFHLNTSSSSSSCLGRIRFDSCSLYPRNEIGPSISSSVVLCVLVLLVYIVVLV